MTLKNTSMGKAMAASKPAAKPASAKKRDPKKLAPLGGPAGLTTKPMGTPAGVGGSDEVV